MMSKRANPMAVKPAFSYDVSEAAKALGKTEATIRNWIKDGVPVMASQKPYLIPGEALRGYLREKNRTAKSPLKPDELYCLSCRAGKSPIDMVVVAQPNTAKTILLKGECQRCGASASRIISAAKAPEFARTFQIKTSDGSEA